MKKQVTYKGKEYEVRWEKVRQLDYIVIYEVNIKRIKAYKEIYNYPLYFLNEYIKISIDDPNVYIEQVKTLFKLWEGSEERKKQKEEIENNKQQALNEWDGVID